MKPTPTIFQTSVFAGVLVAASGAQAVNVSSTWTGNNGDPWNDPVNWTNIPAVAEFPDNTPGTNTFDVAVGIGRPALSTTVEVNALQLGNLMPDGGIVTGSGTLTAKLGTTIGTLGGFDGSGTFNAEGTITVDGGTFTVEGWTVNAMSDTFVGPTAGATINLNASGKLEPQGTLTLANGADILSNAGGGTSHLLTLNGTVDLTATAPTQVSTISANIDAKGGTAVNILGDASLVLPSGRSVTLDSTTVSLNGANGEFDVSSNLTIKGSTTIDAINGAQVSFINAVVDNQGTLTGSGGAGGSFVMTAGSFSGGIIAFSSDLPFRSNTELGTGGNVANIGAWQWESGKITGGGLTNDNDVEGGAATSTGVGGISVENGTFTNNGHFSQLKTLALNANGKIENASDATYILNANLTATATDPETRFLNDGSLVATGAPTVSARFVQNTGTITVKDGAELRLQGPTQLAGNVVIDASSGASILNYRNLSGGSETNNVTYQFMGGDTGNVRFSTGTNAVKGTLNSTGTGLVLLSGGTLKVNGGDSATLNMAATAPFQFDTPLLSTRIQTDGTLTNMGHFTWESGETVGSMPFENQGTVRVTGTMRIGDGAETATVNNTGTINLESGSTGISIQGGSKLDNKTGGLIDFQGGADVFLLTGAAGTPFENNGGELRKSGGSTSLISVPFTQHSGKIAVHDGTLQLNNDPEIASGEIEVMKTGATTPVLLITAPNITTDANITFNDGEVRYGTGSGTHTFKGDLNGTGTDGQVVMPGGTYVVDGGASFGIDGTDTFLNHLNGTLTGDQATNTGTYAFQNGVINNPGGFVNRGTFDWIGGQINTDFTNESPDAAAPGDTATGPANFIIDGNTVHSVFGTAATITNKATITHTDAATLRLDTDTTIQNDPGATYLFETDATGDIDKALPSLTRIQFTNNGTVQYQAADSAVQIDVPFVNGATGEIIITGTSGFPDLAKIQLDDGGRFDGGTARITGAAQLDTRDITVNQIDHQFISTGITAAANYFSADLRGTMTGSGDGHVRISSSTVPEGQTASFDFTGSARVDLASNDLLGTAENLGNMRVVDNLNFNTSGALGGRLRNNGSGTITVDTSSPGRIEFTGGDQTGGAFGEITNSGELVQSHDLRLVDRMRIRNLGTYTIVGGIGGASTLDTRNSDLMSTDPGQGEFDNVIKLISMPGGVANTITIDLAFNNAGEVEARSGTTVFTNLLQYNADARRLSGGTYTLQAGATVRIDGVDILNENRARVRLAGDAVFNGLQKVTDNENEITVQDGNQFTADNDVTNSGDWHTDGENSMSRYAGDYTQTPTGSQNAQAPDDTAEMDLPEYDIDGDADYNGGDVDLKNAKLNVDGATTMNGTNIKTDDAILNYTTMSCTDCTWTVEDNVDVNAEFVDYDGITDMTYINEQKALEAASYNQNGDINFQAGTHTVTKAPDVGPAAMNITGNASVNTGAATTFSGVDFNASGSLTVGSGATLDTNNGASVSASALNVSGDTQVDISSGGRFQVADYTHADGAAIYNLPSLDAYLDGGATEPISINNFLIQDGSVRIGFPSARSLIDDLSNILLAQVAADLRIGDGTMPLATPTLEVGNSPGVLVVQDVAITPNATVQIEIAGPDPAKDYDVLVATGTADLAGTLALSLIAPYTPALGDTFDVLRFATRDPDGPDGDALTTFDLITGAVPATDLAFAPIYTDTTLTLRATVPGDTNFDNAVTVADLSTFALNFGTTTGPGSFHLGDFNGDNAVTVADLSLLALNFGFDLDDASEPIGLSLHDAALIAGIDPATIPEPAVGVPVLLWASATAARRRKSYKLFQYA